MNEKLTLDIVSQSHRCWRTGVASPDSGDKLKWSLRYFPRCWRALWRTLRASSTSSQNSKKEISAACYPQMKKFS